uniref:Zinc finger MYMtype protein 1like [Oreochromis niloticus] n=1 Tax=Lepeophtheirus salmonis TaxID=72036 RepID=A0A0K2UWP0_LEPSM
MFTEIYTNTLFTLQILATLPITVAAAEISLPKLKLIKAKMRSTMHHECLSRLGIICINKELSYQLPYDAIIHEFATKKT